MTKSNLRGLSRSALAAVVAGKTIGQWEGEWVRLPGGFRVPHPELRGAIGLFRAVLRGGVMYIGVATEAGRGFPKRLADFTRESPSARDHCGGRFIHDHLDELELEVLLVGSDRAAARTTRALVGHMLALHRPPKNVLPRRRPPAPPAAAARPSPRPRPLAPSAQLRGGEARALPH